MARWQITAWYAAEQMTEVLASSFAGDLIKFAADAGQFAPLFAFPVLSALIERPFYTSAGFKRNAIWYSIQAHTISLVPALFADPFSNFFFRSANGLIALPLVLILLSTLTEFLYLCFASHGWVKPRLLWILAGNAASVMVWLALFWLIRQFDRPRYRVTLQPYSVGSGIVLAWPCLIAIVASFIVPVFHSKRGNPNNIPVNVDSPT